MNKKLIENLKESGIYYHFKTLVPMSKEELKVRGLKNYRSKGIVQLIYVDGLGNYCVLIGKEHEKFDMFPFWAEYAKKDLSIKYINNKKSSLTND